MNFLKGFLDRGIGGTFFKMKFGGPEFTPEERRANQRCRDCGVKRKMHKVVTHAFVEEA